MNNINDTKSQFTVLTSPTVLTAQWCREVTTESEQQQLWEKIMSTGIMCVCVCVCVSTVNCVLIY